MRRKGYALITGASSGIGKEFAIQLSKKGYSTILVARRADRLRELKSKIPHSHIICADLSKRSELDRLMDIIGNRRIEVLINCAGFGLGGPFLNTDLDRELEMIDVNVSAMHYLMKKMLVRMEEAGGGKILNVASSAGLFPGGPYMSTYYASKSYVVAMTRAVAEELRQSGSPVYVGALCPGPVETEFNQVAEVAFTLNGITASECVKYTLFAMKLRKVIIIPTFVMKMAVLGQRFMPQWGIIRAVSHQQKKKMGMD